MKKIILIPVIAFIFMLLFCMIIVDCSGDSESSEDLEYRNLNRELTAKALSRDFVEERLLYPSGAEFIEEDFVKINDSTYSFKGKVDSHNAFGAVARNIYECTVILRSDETGVCNSISVY